MSAASFRILFVLAALAHQHRGIVHFNVSFRQQCMIFLEQSCMHCCRKLTNTEMLDAWKHVSAAGFGFDAQIYYDAYARHGFGSEAVSLAYIGYLHEEPVTSSTLLMAGDIAGIWDVSTPASFRGRGYGSALTLAMMQEAQDRGYQHAWVWSSNMGMRVYEKVGFVAADFGIHEYQWRKRETTS